MRTKVLRRRKLPVKQFYGGSSWFSITGSMLSWMLDYIEAHPEYVSFFRHGVCIDEVFFSTLAKISPYAQNIVNDSLRFMIWKGTSSGGPKELEWEDILGMGNIKAIFARKIVDIEICKRIKERLCRN